MQFLTENGISMFIWVGLQASSDVLQSLFNANTIGQVDIEMVSQLHFLNNHFRKFEKFEYVKMNLNLKVNEQYFL